MELVKKNKKVERVKNSTVMQLPIEADINISDTKPDARQIIYDRAVIKIDEVKPGTNKVWVKGKILYQILYHTENDKRDIAGMNGEIPFMEEMYLEGVEVQDVVICNARMNQYQIKLINSRKWNFHAKILLQLSVQESVEESFCTQVEFLKQDIINPKLEFQKNTMDYLENIVSKKDLLRIHEEIKIPDNYGSADTIDWKSAEIKSVSFQTFQEKIVAHGELEVFLVFMQDGDDNRNYYDVTVPFSQTLVCQECQENVLADIAYIVNHEEISIRENEDGENRIVYVEIVLELEMKLWKRELSPLISGVYGINCETQAELQQVQFVQLFTIDSFDENIVKKDTLEQAVTAVIHDSISIDVDQCEMKENEIIVHGNAKHNTFVQKAEEGFGSHKSVIPFTSSYKLPGVKSDMLCKAVPVILENQCISKERDEIEYATEVSFHIFVLAMSMEETINQLKVAPINQEQYDALPGIMVHVVQKGDSLWKLGKEYYMSIDMIKEMNAITTDTIEPGEKLILMKMA